MSAREGELLRQVRRALAEPFVDPVRLPVMYLTRAEARAVERVLLGGDVTARSAASATARPQRAQPGLKQPCGRPQAGCASSEDDRADARSQSK